MVSLFSPAQQLPQHFPGFWFPVCMKKRAHKWAVGRPYMKIGFCPQPIQDPVLGVSRESRLTVYVRLGRRLAAVRSKWPGFCTRSFLTVGLKWP